MIPAKEIDGELWIRAADARIKEAAELRLQMDLRDYFAAKAMQGLLSNPKLQQEILKQGGAFGGWIESSSYGWADAMLAERQK